MNMAEIEAGRVLLATGCSSVGVYPATVQLRCPKDGDAASQREVSNMEDAGE
jgi:hypothetical protein